MLKCPFCHFDNEDGALFCDQCKSDLSGVAPTVTAAPVPQPLVPEPVLAEPVPLEPIPEPPVLEALPVTAEPIPAIAEPMPVVAEAVAVEAVEAMPVEPMPVEAMPLEPVAPPAPPPPPPAPPAAAPTPPPTPVAAAPAPPPAAPMAPPAPVAAAPAAPTGDGKLPDGAQPRLLVLRGQKPKAEYAIYEGLNFVGRADEKPVDIDLEEQEPPDRIWCSRQHCCISFEGNTLAIEDLNSANGTFVNRARIYPGQKQALKVNDIVQIGNVQLKVIV
jgi:hypothetical protein